MVNIEELYTEAEKSPCLRLQVGAIGVRADGSKVYGYNHMKDGSPCEITMEMSKLDVFHAECHVLSQVSIGELVSLHITHSPCLNCAKEVHRYRIPYVEYIENYRLPDGIDFLTREGITVNQMGIQNEQIAPSYRERDSQESNCCIDFARLG